MPSASFQLPVSEAGDGFNTERGRASGTLKHPTVSLSLSAMFVEVRGGSWMSFLITFYLIFYYIYLFVCICTHVFENMHEPWA